MRGDRYFANVHLGTPEPRVPERSPYCSTDHKEFVEDFCPECGSLVDEDGNTEEMFVYCSRNCGCHGVGCPMGLRRDYD